MDAGLGFHVLKKDYYDFGVPASYTFSPSPIAANASLAAGASRSTSLTLKDSSGNPVAGGGTYLSFAGPGSASVGTTALTTTPRATVANASGVITITFKAASTLPAPRLCRDDHGRQCRECRDLHGLRHVHLLACSPLEAAGRGRRCYGGPSHSASPSLCR